MGTDSTEQGNSASDALRDVVTEFGGDALRDLWVFDADAQDALFIRDDVAAALEDADVDRYIDNERYGFVTRDTYDNLHYAEFYYTVRGFDSFEQYRTFLSDDTVRVGVLCSFDRCTGGYDFAELTEALTDALADYDLSDLTPA